MQDPVDLLLPLTNECARVGKLLASSHDLLILDLAAKTLELHVLIDQYLAATRAPLPPA